MSESKRRTTGSTAPVGAATSTAGTPAQQRALRAQGHRTMCKLLDAGMNVFRERGYQAARVDDVVRSARTSHGTFYLYFSNKEDLLRALAVDCATAMGALAEGIGPIGPDDAGYEELRRVLDTYLTTYARYGAVIRAWMERQIEDPDIDRLGTRAFTAVGKSLAVRMGENAQPRGFDVPAGASALMAMLERFTYAANSRRLALDPDRSLDTLTRLVHRGFFGASRTVPSVPAA